MNEPEYRFEVFDTRSRNVIDWAPTLEEAKAKVERRDIDQSGLVIFDDLLGRIAFRYHGPMVAP